ncbi:MAG TPA: serine hydrolase [Acidimicrobiia bacterium]|jgi:hypothetical protein|nr:serine hydrolase [Acidimicrobiia bacterium]
MHRRSPGLWAVVAACAIVAGACSSSSSSGAGSTGASSSTKARTTAAVTTTTTAPRPTTNDADAAMLAWVHSRQGTTDVSIGDVATGNVTDVTPLPQTQMRIASVVKVSIAIAILRQLHAQGQPVSSTIMNDLTVMIEQSDNDAAQRLWTFEGGPDALLVTERTAGLTQTAYQVGHGWGFSLTTAHDQARLEAMLAGNRMLDPQSTQLELNLMHHVVSSEQWGFADVVAPDIAPAIKNGWYEDTDAPVWRVHCTAIFDSPLLAHPFSIAVFNRYPATLGMGYGEDTCRGIARRLGAYLERK